MVARATSGVNPAASFAETYGVLERVTTIEPADNSCSKARTTKQIKRRPGARRCCSASSDELGRVRSLEDISQSCLHISKSNRRAHGCPFSLRTKDWKRTLRTRSSNTT